MLKLNTASVSQEELSRHYYSGSLTYARKRSEQIAIDDKTSLQSPEYSVGQLHIFVDRINLAVSPTSSSSTPALSRTGVWVRRN